MKPGKNPGFGKPGFSKTRDFPSHGGPGFTQASAPPGDPVPPVDPAPARVCSLPIRLNEAKAAAGAGKQAQHGEAGRRCNMTRGAGGSHGDMHDDQPSGKWKSRKRRAWSLRCERVHGSGSEKGGEGCAIRCDGWQDKVFKCHEIQPEQGTRKGRFARSLLATLSEGEGRQEREGGWRGRRTAVVLSDLQRLSLPHSRLLARRKEP